MITVRETSAEEDRGIAGEINQLWRREMSMFNKEKSKKIMNELAQLPPGGTLAPVPEPPTRSHDYASGLAAFKQLENELQQALLYGQEQAGKREVAEAMIAEMRSEYDKWRKEHLEEHTMVLNQRDQALADLGDLNARLDVIMEQLDRVRRKPAPSEHLPIAAVLPMAQEEEHHDHSSLQKADS